MTKSPVSRTIGIGDVSSGAFIDADIAAATTAVATVTVIPAGIMAAATTGLDMAPSTGIDVESFVVHTGAAGETHVITCGEQFIHRQFLVTEVLTLCLRPDGAAGLGYARPILVRAFLVVKIQFMRAG